MTVNISAFSLAESHSWNFKPKISRQPHLFPFYAIMIMLSNMYPELYSIVPLPLTNHVVPVRTLDVTCAAARLRHTSFGARQQARVTHRSQNSIVYIAADSFALRNHNVPSSPRFGQWHPLPLTITPRPSSTMSKR